MTREAHSRPALTPEVSVEALYDHYWLKEELVAFCVEHGILSTGRKLAILARVAEFLRTGEARPRRERSEKPAARTRDSDAPLTLDTPVVTFKSDSETREFFESQIGSHFHFTAHLNKFWRHRDGLTYGDLVREWVAEHERRKDKAYKPPIMQSCEYNQYIRDYFADPRNEGRAFSDAVRSWNSTKTKPGDRKYRAEQGVRTDGAG